jgi:hypothetical protein
MATPTLMSTPIIDGNTWTWQCSCSLCDHRSSSMFILPHQCDYLSPFDINGKGYISLGLLPCLLLHHLNNLSPFDKGNHSNVMLMTWLPIISPPRIMPLQSIMGRIITPPVDMSPSIFSAR